MSFVSWFKDPRFEMFQGLSKTVGRWLCDSLTGNQVTLVGLFVCAPMVTAFLNGYYLVGAILLTISLLTDFLDGAVSRFQQAGRSSLTLEEEMRLSFWQRINYKGVTHLGRTLDPIVDKVRFFGVIYSIGVLHVLTETVIALTVLAIFLTFVRPVKQYLNLDNVGANKFGKFKIWIEIIGMATLVFFPFGLQNSTAGLVTNAVFVIAFIFGLASLAGHIITGFQSYRKGRLEEDF